MTTNSRAFGYLLLTPWLTSCSDSSDSFRVEPAVAAPLLDCNPLTPRYCGLPHPNNYWTLPDDSTPIGKRLALPGVIMPARVDGKRSLTTALNEMDGFSPDTAAITHWADDVSEPHGRATELRAIGDSLRRLYDTAIVENPCEGPCEENDRAI